MQCSTRFPRRFARYISQFVCLALLFTTLSIVPRNLLVPRALAQLGPTSGEARKKAKTTPPEAGAPAFALPNLDELKQQIQREPVAPPPIPSSVRSKRKPLEPPKKLRAQGSAGARNANVRGGNPIDSDQFASSTSSARLRRARVLHHTGRSPKSALSAPTWLADDQYVRHFLAAAIPNYQESEVTYWTKILRAAEAQGLQSLSLAGREMGRTIFESSAYRDRNRADHDYIYDLYQTYMMRAPDASGWAFWEAHIPPPPSGRELVRDAFLDASSEFSDLLATLTAGVTVTGEIGSLASALVDPFNQTGDQMAARDCEWSLPLISLPGRAGLDLGLGLSYSSMVWTRSGSYLYFDEDYSSISPGFRLGFASIRGPYFDAQVGKRVYLLVSSSGRRVSLRQVGSSNVYESADSSNLQLTDNSSSNSSLWLRTADGTQMTYLQYANGWQVQEIKDRNGNRMWIQNDWRGDIQYINDTLHRTINFNPDGNGNLLSITQGWNGGSHTWATFSWGAAHNMNASGFTGASVVGTYDGEQIPVLRQVGLADGSYYVFQYTGAGQAQVIRRYTADNVQRSFTYYDYDNASSDCPRLLDMWTWADRWTGINGLPTEAMTTFTLPGDGSHQMTAPDGTVYKDFYGLEWQKGLVTRSEVWSGGALERLTLTDYEHDGALHEAYPTNPRVKETNVSDAWQNQRRTRMTHTAFGLLSDVYEYAANGSSVLRRTHTDYTPEGLSNYTGKHIIGLPSAQYVCDGAQGETPCNDNSGGSLQAKTTYRYDETATVDQGTPIWHDTAYGAGFQWRGNLTSTRRYDILNQGQYTSASLQYNTNGSVISVVDAANHATTISYADSYSPDGTNNTTLTFATLAYPTVITDADGYANYLRYNYDFGARTLAQGPPPANQTQGAIQTFLYDNAGRLQRVTNGNNGAYTRYEYGPYYLFTYASINNVADDASSTQIFDGLGRVIGTASNHPGSVGGYRAQNTQYDIMGRVTKQSNPTEVNGNWVASGDDVAGWYYTQQTYDWKGRPLLTTNQDGSIKYASYAGCGCAGGEVVTFTDEENRKQKIYSDALGRPWKSEVLNWNWSVYSTTTNTFNALDQVTNVRQTDNATGAYQDTTLTYDGYGRLKTKHVPEQNAGTATVYTYKADDALESVTDARGASATYIYNNGRHLVNEIHFSAPSGITPTSNVTFGYDAVGNRSSMTDGAGTTSYGYDSLSRMTSETRGFSGLSGSYALSYQYNLAGELKKITDPTNATINYNYDGMGRISSVNGENTLVENVSTYASNLSYRAWGALKDLDYGNGVHSHTSFNQRFLPASAVLSNLYGNTSMSWSYDYFDDGRLHDAYDAANHTFDRSQEYDHLGRLKEAYSGREVSGQTPTFPADNPYRQTIQYDVWNNQTAKSGHFWRSNQIDSASYVNNRRAGFGYDAEGNATYTTGGNRNYFDAANKETNFVNWRWTVGGSPNHPTVQPVAEITQNYSGDGQPAKRIETRRTEELLTGGPNTNITETTTTTFYLYSSVLGGAKVVELDSNGAKTKGYVYANGERLAKQEVYSSYSAVTWTHANAATNSWIETGSLPIPIRQEMDPVGAEVGTADPFISDPNPNYLDIKGQEPLYLEGGDPFDYSGGCTSFGMPISCSDAARYLGSGLGQINGIKTNGVNSRGHQNGGTSEFVDETRIGPFWINDTRYEYADEGKFVESPHVQGKVPLPDELTPIEHIKQNLAFSDADTVLLLDEACGKFFANGRSLKEVRTILRQLATSFAYSSKSTSIASTSGSGANAVITLRPPFFADDNLSAAGQNAGYVPNPTTGKYEELNTSRVPRQYRALTILHELAHALGLIPHDSLKADPTGEQSTKNDGTIDDKCGRGLDRLPEN